MDKDKDFTPQNEAGNEEKESSPSANSTDAQGGEPSRTTNSNSSPSDTARPSESGAGQGKKDLDGELKQFKKECDEYLDGWKRAKADLINYKRDELKRLEQVVHFASEDIMRDMITVLDSFDLALASMKKDDPAEKGVYLIRSKLEKVLKGKGLNKINVEIGDKFDPTYHEAIGVIENESGKSETIAEELETGYTLHKKVIRAARVKIYK